MTCAACGEDLPLVDNCCEPCWSEGPYTRAARLSAWLPRFAWLPVRDDCDNLIWLRRYQERQLTVFGRTTVEVRRYG